MQKGVSSSASIGLFLDHSISPTTAAPPLTDAGFKSVQVTMFGCTGKETWTPTSSPYSRAPCAVAGHGSVRCQIRLF